MFRFVTPRLATAVEFAVVLDQRPVLWFEETVGVLGGRQKFCVTLSAVKGGMSPPH